MKNILLQIQEEFLKALQEKNSWGKNEVHLLYITISNRVLSEAFIVQDVTIKNVTALVDQAITVAEKSNVGTDEKPF